MDSNEEMILVDVRMPIEFGICHIPGSTSSVLYLLFSQRNSASIDIPLAQIAANPGEPILNSSNNIFVICRLGNDSQIAAKAILDAGHGGRVRDVIGGLRGWAKTVDTTFPVY